MIINIFNEQDALGINPEKVQLIVANILEKEDCICDELSVHFVDTKTISDLHGKFFNDYSTTDCISFPLDDEEDPYYRVLGEIFVCPETAIQYAKDHQIDAYQETQLYIIHGILHLLGYDDIEEEDKRIMRIKESEHVQNLAEKGLHL